MSLLETRPRDLFPVLDAAQMETAKRFASGPARSFAPQEVLYGPGEAVAPAWLVLEGAVRVVRRDGLEHEAAWTSLGPGQFTGEIRQLSGRAPMVEVRAEGSGCTAVPFDGAHLRALVVGSAELGEVVMRAFILRRAALIEEGRAGPVLVGPRGDPDVVRIEGFMGRASQPYTVLDSTVDGEALVLVERLGMWPEDLPLLVCPNGRVLKRPTDVEVGACLGITPDLDPERTYDVVVVGAGPAGLAAAVYAASEGLSVLVLDQHAVGGQAGESARIENYLGFPTGISGRDLTARAVSQAVKFGAEIAVPLQVARLVPAPSGRPLDPLRVDLTDGRSLRARTLVIASGARYRRPDIPGLATLEGVGVSYWASPVEANLVRGEDVAVLGGGNSAGQAVVFLATKVRRLHLIVRGSGLDSMSQYLADRVGALDVVELHRRTDVVGLEGDRRRGLAAVVLRDRATGVDARCAVRHLFVFIGAEPNAEWVRDAVAVDPKGFVLTGVDAPTQARESGRPLLLETSVPGVFAIGDVRASSEKRVAAAVGEGAAVVAEIHETLARRERA